MSKSASMSRLDSRLATKPSAFEEPTVSLPPVMAAPITKAPRATPEPASQWNCAPVDAVIEAASSVAMPGMPMIVRRPPPSGVRVAVT